MGAMTLHIGSPIAHPERIRSTLASLRSAFANVSPYLVSVPLYGGLWMMACCSSSLHPGGMTPREVELRIAQRGLTHLQYYNGDMHRAGFALPNFVRALVARGPRCCGSRGLPLPASSVPGSAFVASRRNPSRRARRSSAGPRACRSGSLVAR